MLWSTGHLARTDVPVRSLDSRTTALASHPAGASSLMGVANTLVISISIGSRTSMCWLLAISARHQKHVPTRGRRRTPPKASHHSLSTRETTCLHKGGSDAPFAPSKSRSDMEIGAVDRSARDGSRAGIARDIGFSGRTQPEQQLPNQND
jgi:hypothetical protein